MKYVCETCQKAFAQKGHMEDHNNRKRPCKKDNMIEALIEKKVQEALSKTNVETAKIDTISTPQIHSSTMDYSKKTREELIAICKEKSVKGYSGKKKEEIAKLLDASVATQSMASQPVASQPVALNKIRYIDLFCGLGAFHTAFNASSEFECVLACDINEGVRHIYKANYNLEPKSDIRKIDVDTIPDFEVLCAGFPCQPFSIAGNGEGFKDAEKGNLFFDILKIIDKKNPPMCILENVKNLKTHDKGNTYKTIETELKTRGYTLSSKVINATEYGSPQARHRIFIVATKNKAFAIPDGNKTQIPVSSIIDESVVHNTIDREKYDLVEKPKKKNVFGKPNVLFDVVSKKTTKGGRQGERVYSIESAGVTVCASSGGPGAKTGLYKVGNAIRRLTVKETLAMFGFPATYKFPSTSDENALFYLGNSIVVNVVSAFVPVVKSWFNRV
jgi:DNA (cytosine-5)-methyltransferase 1